MPLFEKARIEVYLPDVPRAEYRDLLGALEQEFTYTFGGCTTVRGLEGNYLSRLGLRMRDRVNHAYTDIPVGLDEKFDRISRYADELRDAALQALEEEAVLIVVFKVYHAEWGARGGRTCRCSIISIPRCTVPAAGRIPPWLGHSHCVVPESGSPNENQQRQTAHLLLGEQAGAKGRARRAAVLRDQVRKDLKREAERV